MCIETLWCGGMSRMGREIHRVVGSDELDPESPGEDVSSVLHVASSGDWSPGNVIVTGVSGSTRDKWSSWGFPQIL